MSLRELLIQGVFVAIAAGALGAALFINRGEERRQYRDRCACENCRCRCHLEGGNP